MKVGREWKRISTETGKGDRSFRFPCFRRFVTERYTSARGEKKKNEKRNTQEGVPRGGRNARKRSFERQAARERTCKYMREPK